MKRPKVGELYKWNGDNPCHYLIKEVASSGLFEGEYWIKAIEIETSEEEEILFSEINGHNYEWLSG